jgi:5-methylcytosine-specific restriction endonuclease McrA
MSEGDSTPPNTEPLRTVCGYCNKVFSLVGRQRRVYCSQLCRRAGGVANAAAKGTASARQRKKRSTPEGRERYRQQQKARAERIKQLTVGPPFTRKQVFDRDGWKCAKCGIICVKATKQYNPSAASIDHIIPICKDGPHSFENCRTMCWECNSRQGAELWRECKYHAEREASYPRNVIEVLPPPLNPPPPLPPPLQDTSLPKILPDGSVRKTLCKGCGNEFSQRPNIAGGKKYCSELCRTAYYKSGGRTRIYEKSERGRVKAKEQRRRYRQTEAGKEQRRKSKKRYLARLLSTEEGREKYRAMKRAERARAKERLTSLSPPQYSYQPLPLC